MDQISVTQAILQQEFRSVWRRLFVSCLPGKTNNKNKSTMQLYEPRSEQEWEQYYDLRHRILREPWGQAKGSERDATDAQSMNRMIVDDDGRVVSVGRVHLNSPSEAQVRYMAVEKGLQGKGIGRVMMQALEDEARRAGASVMMLEAREKAVPFYERLGYQTQKTSYLLFGEIQHYTMTKSLLTD